MKVPLIGGSNRYKDVQINPQRTINWYVQTSAQQEDNKEQQILKPTPGLVLFSEGTGNKLRGLYSIHGVTYYVENDTLGSVDSQGNRTTLGTLSASIGQTNQVTMRMNMNGQLMVADHSFGYIYDINTEVFEQITDEDFPGCETLSYLDGYFIVVADGRVYYSELGNGLAWVATDVFTPNYSADFNKATSAFGEVLYNFGENTTELYVHDGTPFSREPRGVLHYGIVAPHSMEVIDNSLFFLGRYEGGAPCIVIISLNSDFKTISLSGITERIDQAINYDDAYAWSYASPDDHMFYVLTIPGIDKTFAYDISTNTFHEFLSFSPVTMELGRHRGYCHTYNYSKHLIGDYYTGNIYYFDWETFVEGEWELPIRRQRDSKIFCEEYKLICVHELVIDTNTRQGTLSGQGRNPVLIFQISRNGGLTWTDEEYLPLSGYGEDKKAHTSMLGSGRDIVIRIAQTDPVKTILMGARAFISVGAN